MERNLSEIILRRDDSDTEVADADVAAAADMPGSEGNN